MTVTYISWAEHCSRSDHTARELGGVSHMVYWTSLGSHPATVWLKYLGQTWSTWRLLERDRPAAVFVMTPPLFAPLAVLAWCRLRRRPFVIDAHTAAFMHPRWRHFQGLQFWLCRQAATTIVTNDHLRALVEGRGGHVTIVPDIPVRFEALEPFELSPRFNVAVVCSFNPDEPVREMLEAARRLPDVQFYMTGKPKDLARHTTDPLPANVTLTGFLSTGAYGTLLRTADAVMTLTVRDHTMLRAAWESVYQDTPVIVSDWPILREAFDEGAVHVDNTPEGIARGIEAIRQDPDRFKAGICALRARKEQRWEGTRRALRARLSLPA
jgi:hypothetical protein